jgi:small subunit ribosomal protein S8
MSTNYRLAEVLSLIKNGQQARLGIVRYSASKFIGNVLEVLAREGYINGYKRVEDGSKADFEIELKYYEGERVINEINCISKPGRRVYYGISDLPKMHNGLGIAILSTSKGVMSDFEARQANVGGEVLCSVF